MRLTVAAVVILLLCGVMSSRVSATTYNIGGTWNNPWIPAEPEEGGFIWELSQDGSSITGTLRVTAPCEVIQWPVTGSIDTGTGAFTLIATDPVESDYCVVSLNYVGSFDSSTALSGTWTNDYTSGAFVMTLQAPPPTLSVDDASIVRGDTVTFAIDNLSGGSVSGSGWQYVSDTVGTFSRTSGIGDSTWEGILVDSGTAHVTVERNGVTYDGDGLSASVTVSPRTTFAFTAVSSVPRLNGYNAALTLTNFTSPILSTTIKTGAADLAIKSSTDRAQVTGSGPNAGAWWVTQAYDYERDPMVSTTYDWIVQPDVANTGGPFYAAQTGSYNAAIDTTPACNSTNYQDVNGTPGQMSIGWISGANLLANTGRHEASTSGNSHWYQYKITQDNSAYNLGVRAEQMIDSPTQTAEGFLILVTGALNSKKTQINNAASIEPCDPRRDAQCVCQGYINPIF